ncbi:hypothetical protein FB451DRAFT_1164616 [Mycena latifolia]|nr:hypothetical protein FB451DRAFT_1164616 [Mycena latifolia]
MGTPIRRKRWIAQEDDSTENRTLDLSEMSALPLRHRAVTGEIEVGVKLGSEELLAKEVGGAEPAGSRLQQANSTAVRITSGAHREGEFDSWRQVSILQVAKIATERRYNTRKGKDPIASSSNAPPPTPVINSRRGPQRILQEEILLAENLPEQPPDELPLHHSEDETSELSRLTTPEPETPTTPSPQSTSEPSSETLTSESSLDPSNTSAEQTPEPPILCMPPKLLPARGAKTAPSFDGKAGRLECYFRDVADTGQDTECTTDDELIQIALRYVDIDDEQLWGRKKVNGMTFDAFKTEIKMLYPGSDGEKLYTWADLREVVRKAHEDSPKDREDFALYKRNFQRIGDFLKVKGKISDREMNEWFMKGIHSDFCFRVLQRLQIVMHDQPSDEPYAMADVIKAAEWVIDGTPASIYGAVDEDHTVVKKEMVEIVVSQLENFGKTFSLQMSATMDAKLESERNQGQPRRNQSVAYQNQEAPSPRWNQNAPARLPPQNQAFRDSTGTPQGPTEGQAMLGGGFEPGKCGFCSKPGHYVRECPVIMEYIAAGKCRRNEEGRVVLPNGWYIPRAIQGANIVERIDKWHKMNPVPAPARDTPPHMLYMATTYEEETPEEPLEIYFSHENGSVRLDNLLTEQIEVLLETRKKAEKNKNRETFDGIVLPPKPPSVPKKKVAFVPEKETLLVRPQSQAPARDVPSNGAPKPYVAKYKAPIEDTINMADMVERVLGSKFEIFQREFFAIYPDGRKYLRELLTSKKVPMVEVTYAEVTSEHEAEQQYILRYEEENGDHRDEKLTSSEIDALRVIDLVIDSEHTVEGILDQGSEIVAMN